MRVYPIEFPKILTVYQMEVIGETILVETSDGLYWALNKKTTPCQKAKKVNFVEVGAMKMGKNND